MYSDRTRIQMKLRNLLCTTLLCTFTHTYKKCHAVIIRIGIMLLPLVLFNSYEIVLYGKFVGRVLLHVKTIEKCNNKSFSLHL